MGRQVRAALKLLVGLMLLFSICALVVFGIALVAWRILVAMAAT